MCKRDGGEASPASREPTAPRPSRFLGRSSGAFCHASPLFTTLRERTTGRTDRGAALEPRNQHKQVGCWQPPRPGAAGPETLGRALGRRPPPQAGCPESMRIAVPAATSLPWWCGKSGCRQLQEPPGWRRGRRSAPAEQRALPRGSASADTQPSPPGGFPPHLPYARAALLSETGRVSETQLFTPCRWGEGCGNWPAGRGCAWCGLWGA